MVPPRQIIRVMSRPDPVTHWLRPALRRVALALIVALCTCIPAAALANPLLAGEWVLPVDEPGARVVRGFDPPAQHWLAGHRGVDLAAPPGATIRAAGRGVVTYAGLVAGRGVITVSHGQLRTTYEPAAATVAVGHLVEAGEPIGTLTAVASHCAPDPCLHWGLLRGQTYLDPLSLVGGHGIRLLPLGPGAVLPQAPPTSRTPAGPSVDAHGGQFLPIGLAMAVAAASGVG